MRHADGDARNVERRRGISDGGTPAETRETSRGDEGVGDDGTPVETREMSRR